MEDREACRIEAGDLIVALDEAGWAETVELKFLAAGQQAVDPRPDGITLFKSVGIGLEDVAVAGWIYQRAE